MRRATPTARNRPRGPPPAAMDHAARVRHTTSINECRCAPPEGAAVAWVRMGEGNVNIDEYVRQYAALCPGRALSLESIVTGPRVFPYRDPKFWEAYRTTPAWEFERFFEIAERGRARPPEPRAPSREAAIQKEREDLEASIQYTRKLLA